MDTTAEAAGEKERQAEGQSPVDAPAQTAGGQ